VGGGGGGGGGEGMGGCQAIGQKVKRQWKVAYCRLMTQTNQRASFIRSTDGEKEVQEVMGCGRATYVLVGPRLCSGSDPCPDENGS